MFTIRTIIAPETFVDVETFESHDAAIDAAIARHATVDVFDANDTHVARVHVDGGIDFK